MEFAGQGTGEDRACVGVHGRARTSLQLNTGQCMHPRKLRLKKELPKRIREDNP